MCLARFPQVDLRRRGRQAFPPVYRVDARTSRGSIVIEVHRDWARLAPTGFARTVTTGYFRQPIASSRVAGRWARFGISGEPAVRGRWRTRTIRTIRAHVSRTCRGNKWRSPSPGRVDPDRTPESTSALEATCTAIRRTRRASAAVRSRRRRHGSWRDRPAEQPNTASHSGSGIRAGRCSSRSSTAATRHRPRVPAAR